VITLQSFPRLHICLIDLGCATYRKYGGVGFSIDGPEIKIEVSPNRQKIEIDLKELDYQTKKDVLDAIGRYHKCYPRQKAKISIIKMPPQHIGLGIKTSLILIILRAM